MLSVNDAQPQVCHELIYRSIQSGIAFVVNFTLRDDGYLAASPTYSFFLCFSALRQANEH